MAAPVWFIGLEEGLGGQDDDDLVHNLEARGNWGPTRDLVESHCELFSQGEQIDLFECDRTGCPRFFTQVWDNQVRVLECLYSRDELVALYEGEHDWNNRQFIRHFVPILLGRENGLSFLGEYSPIPSRNARDRDYWHAFFGEFLPDAAREELIEERRQNFLEMSIAGNEPRLIVCFGQSFWKRFIQFFELNHVKQIHPSAQYKQIENKGFILIPFLGNGQITHVDLQDIFALPEIQELGLQLPA